jgi:hypothetical protein
MLLTLIGCMGRFERPHVPNVVVGPPGAYNAEQYQADIKALEKATGNDAINLRNKIVYSVLAEIDHVFFDCETRLFLNEGTFNVGSDVLRLGLAAGGTISRGERSKTILSALLSGVSGVSLSVDKNFFRQQTVQAISNAMEAERDKLKALILQQLSKDLTAYPFQAARADLIRYFYAGTLPSGLQHLAQQAATNAQNQQADLHQLQLSNITLEQLNQAFSTNQQIARDFQTNDLTKEVNFLKAMGITVDPVTKEKVESELCAGNENPD